MEPFKQGQSCLIFKLGQKVRDTGLRNSQQPRRTGYGAGFHNGVKGLKLTKANFHGQDIILTDACMSN